MHKYARPNEIGEKSKEALQSSAGGGDSQYDPSRDMQADIGDFRLPREMYRLPTIREESALQKAIASDDSEGKCQDGQKALVRQSTIFKESSLVLGEHEKTFAEAYSYDSSPFMNDFLRCGREKNYPDGYFPKEANIPGDSLSRVVQFIDIVNMLPSAGDVTLYRGGTSGEIFRMGSVKVGDVLCNTDFASFTESPHIAKEFSFFRNDDEYYFSDGSIIYILDKHKSAKAFAPLSIRSEEPYFEAESLIPPGKFFKVTGVGEKNALLSGKNQTYIEVLIHEIESLKPKVANSITLSSAIEFPDHVYDLKTGERIDIEVWSSRLGSGSDKCIAWS